MANTFRRSNTLGIAASLQLSNSLGRAPPIQHSHSMGRAPSEASRQLLLKAKEGDAIEVGRLLEQPPEALLDINARGERQMTPLHLAAENNHPTVVQRLLTAKLVDLNALDHQGRTPLIIAAQTGHAKVVQLLHEAGANVLLCAQGGYTALHVAAWHGHTEVVNQLLGSSGLGQQDFTFPQETAPKSSKSSKSSHSSKELPSPRAITRKLFKRGSECTPSQNDRLSSNLFNSQGKIVPPINGDIGGDLPSTPEDFPKFQHSKVSLLKMLEAKTSGELFTALHLAAARGHHQVVVALIQAYGQAVGITEVFNNVQERGGKEALNLVRTSIIQILNSQEDMGVTDDVKSGVLDKALGRILFPGSDNSSISWSTVDSMASYVNVKDCIGRTPLHYAAWEEQAEVVERLLELFIVNVNAADIDGFTPLHLAARKGGEKVVELLNVHDSKHQTLNPNLRARQSKATWAKILEAKRLQQKMGTILVAINLQDVFVSEERDGMTALHYAVEWNHAAIVNALAGRADIDVFATASPTTRASTVMEVLTAAEEEEKPCDTPLTMAFSTQNSTALGKLLKSGKRNKIMQELHMLRGYFSQSSKFEGNRKAVKDYHTELLKTAVRIVRVDPNSIENELFSSLERELAVALNTLLHKSDRNEYTLLHHAAFAGLGPELESLLSVPDVAKNINVGDIDNQTALHFATIEEELHAVKVLMHDKTIKPNEEDRHNRTALQLAFEKGSRDIISLLMECPDVKLGVEKLYRERAVNENAANAILVVAALIASVTFAGWLQPPLGLVQYNGLTSHAWNTTTGAPSYAAVAIPSVRYFWIFNSLSFYLAMATVISGAAEVLPMRDAFIGQEVRMVRGGLVRSSMLLVSSIVCVLGAFAAAGFSCLPPIKRYENMMFWTTISGMWSCFSMLCIFWFRMGSMLVTTSGHHQLKWLRFQEADLKFLPLGKFLWMLFKIFKFIPENYTRFHSTRSDDEDSNSCKRRIFFYLVKVFRLDREEYWRYHVK